MGSRATSRADTFSRIAGEWSAGSPSAEGQVGEQGKWGGHGCRSGWKGRERQETGTAGGEALHLEC